MRLQDLKTKLFGTAPQELEVSEAIAHMIIEARIAKGLTQTQLAELADTKQPSIARVENGYYKLSFLEKLAKALNTKLLPPRLAFLEAEKTTLNTSSHNVINEAIDIVVDVERNQPMYTVQSLKPQIARSSQILRVVSR